jgi:hypothetical protein
MKSEFDYSDHLMSANEFTVKYLAPTCEQLADKFTRHMNGEKVDFTMAEVQLIGMVVNPQRPAIVPVPQPTAAE